MRGFVTVILFFLFALAFARTEYVDAVPDETRDDNSGFGLSMMKERVYLLSGTLSIESAPGKGCSIIVSIPKMKEGL